MFKPKIASQMANRSKNPFRKGFDGDAKHHNEIDGDWDGMNNEIWVSKHFDSQTNCIK